MTSEGEGHRGDVAKARPIPNRAASVRGRTETVAATSLLLFTACSIWRGTAGNIEGTHTRKARTVTGCCEYAFSLPILQAL